MTVGCDVGVAVRLSQQASERCQGDVEDRIEASDPRRTHAHSTHSQVGMSVLMAPTLRKPTHNPRTPQPRALSVSPRGNPQGQNFALHCCPAQTLRWYQSCVARADLAAAPNREEYHKNDSDIQIKMKISQIYDETKYPISKTREPLSASPSPSSSTLEPASPRSVFLSYLILSTLSK